MSLRNMQSAAALAALLAASLVIAGCGKEPTKPKPQPLTANQASEIAQSLGPSFQHGNAIEKARAWCLLNAPSPYEPASAPSTRRPQRSMAVTEDGDPIQFEMLAFDAANRQVPLETTSWDQIARITMKWTMRLDFADDSTGWLWRNQAAGSYDLTGLLATEPEWSLSGAAQDTFEFRLTVPPVTSAGSGLWKEEAQALRISKDPAALYPLGGRETMFVDETWTTTDASGPHSDHTHADVAVEYDGTQWARMTVDGTYHFRLDLVTGQVESLPS